MDSSPAGDMSGTVVPWTVVQPGRDWSCSTMDSSPARDSGSVPGQLPIAHMLKVSLIRAVLCQP